MVTVADFKRLIELENKAYHIYVDGDEVHGLHYDEEDDWTEYLNGCEEMICTFTFVDDKYTIIHNLGEYKDSKWTVEEHKEIEW